MNSTFLDVTWWGLTQNRKKTKQTNKFPLRQPIFSLPDYVIWQLILMVFCLIAPTEDKTKNVSAQIWFCEECFDILQTRTLKKKKQKQNQKTRNK